VKAPVLPAWLAGLQAIRTRVYSQYVQDGWIAEVFRNVGTTNKVCVEFGFNSSELTGGTGANTARLVIEDGWHPILLDAEYENPQINLHRELLTYENIGQVFRKHGVPQAPDYVSIDVDSIDLWLFLGMLQAGFRPRLVSSEYNSSFPLDVAATLKNDPSLKCYHVLADGSKVGDGVFGASLLALYQVAMEFDYRLACVERGSDVFFLRGDLSPVGVPLANYADCTNIPAHHTPTLERLPLMVQSPSQKPLPRTPWDHLFPERTP
jgi:hypothetical protein